MKRAERFAPGSTVTASLLIAAYGGLACAQDYPVKPIRIVVAYSPGGGTDLLSRILARNLTESWGQTVIVDNRPGAGGILGTEILARAAPDGYT